MPKQYSNDIIMTEKKTKVKSSTGEFDQTIADKSADKYFLVHYRCNKPIDAGRIKP
jgi:hypothetical protein